MNRRRFLSTSIGLAATPLIARSQPKVAAKPKLRFYGSTQQVSGSCHLLETSKGLFVVDCGMFYNDVGTDPNRENRELPFDPKEVTALFLTHAHVDHNGRLPMLYEKGFRGPIYCTDCTRDISKVMLDMSAAVVAENGEAGPLYKQESVNPTIGLMEALPYNTKLERSGVQVRYTDAGHILGSAMVEVWVDGAKILFSGDMGPDSSPILCKPTQHYQADAVLVESTYGPVPRDQIDYRDFGKTVQAAIAKGGSVLIPAFSLHKTQTLIYILNKLMAEGIVDKKVPIFSDSSTAHRVTELYDRYREYYDADAKQFSKERKSLFYANRYREARHQESLASHDGNDPGIYISTSGMLDHATAPKHLIKMAGNAKNSLLLVGYQSPDSVGKKIQSGEKRVAIPWEERGANGFEREMRLTDIKLSVANASGFSSHARGGQILDWLHDFKEVGQVFVVHGDRERATGMAEAAAKMGVPAVAPKRGQEFVIGAKDRVKPKLPPMLKAPVGPVAPNPVDK